MALPDSLYSRLDAHCTADQIKDLMREQKKNLDKKSAREIVLGENKEDTIKNLRTAVGRLAIPLDEVVNLLRDSEENGRQHIYYYKAANSSVRSRLRGADYVAGALFGDEYDDTIFPSFEIPKNSYKWADFRHGSKGKPRDWVAKLYGHEVKYVYVDSKTDRKGDLLKRYTPEEGFTVCVIRWNDPDLLEIRIDNWQANKRNLGERLRLVFNEMSNVFSPKDLVPWDLVDIRSNLVRERKLNASIYTVSHIELLDSQSGRSAFYPRTAEENADDAEERSRAIDELLIGNASCRNFGINWLPNDGNPLTSEIKSVCGSYQSNELIISARTDSSSVDYVTNQLRNFDR